VNVAPRNGGQRSALWLSDAPGSDARDQERSQDLQAAIQAWQERQATAASSASHPACEVLERRVTVARRCHGGADM
jgi:hypothetical protein